MTQVTDTDIRELKDLITGLDKKIDGIDQKIDDLKADVRVMDTRLTEVEKKIDKQDARLWAFVGVLFTIAFGGLTTLLVRYLSFTNPTP
jgi:septal ring factor EnvC (AmiA/AmiB activator)